MTSTNFATSLKNFTGLKNQCIYLTFDKQLKKMKIFQYEIQLGSCSENKNVISLHLVFTKGIYTSFSLNLKPQKLQLLKKQRI